MKQRHSVRQYNNKEIEYNKRDVLNQFVNELNEKHGFHFQVIYDEATCFDTRLAHYGIFRNVIHYIALVADKSIDIVTIGYYGEAIVLKA